MDSGRRILGLNGRTALILAVAGLAAAALLFIGPRQTLETKHGLIMHKTQLVADMRTDLYAAAESEKSAVLAETDQASESFAAAATAAVGRVASALALLRKSDGADATEETLVLDFAKAFDEYRKVDEEILSLAVQNTNLKALALSFGEAAAALADLELALAPLSGSAQAQRALAEALRVQSLHAPHIIEKTEARMDALERDMARAEKRARTALAELPAGAARTAALAALERHGKTTAEVVRLSRQNTNVRSLALSLERKTKVLAACSEPLRALEEHLRERLGTRATR